MASTVDEADPLAKERDVKFKKWLQNKAIKEKAFEYLSKLDPARASYDDKLIDVGVAMCAIERMLGEDEGDQQKHSQSKDDGGLSPLELLKATSAGQKKTEVKGSSAKKTLKSAWIKWSMEFHSFSMLILTDSDLSQISDAVKEYLFSEADLVASAGSSSEEISKADKKKNILPSLKYFFPTVPKPGEKPRPLTNDQKVQNNIYMRELKKMWKKAKEELDNRVLEYVAKKMKTGGGSGGRESMEKEMKSKAMDESPSDNSIKPANQAKFYESQCLNELSLKQLRLWIEEDEDDKLASQNESAAEKIREAKKSHEQFVKKKDSLRIRMPEEVVVPKTAAMTYGREFTGVRATGISISSTVELMAGSGLKFVHATSKGRKGVEGDLEKSRNKLLKQGFVAKENFDEEEQDLYEKEKRENKVLTEKRQLEQKAKEDNAKAYEEWLLLKEMRDQALKCLGLMKKPILPLEEDDIMAYQPTRKSMTSVDIQHTKTRMAFNALNLRNPDHREVFDNMVDVGKNLKKVDRTLFAEWAKWADGVIPISVATTLWDYFPPMACDVHSAAFSQVRDSFLKLLRPGVDYRETFMQFVEKTVFARRLRETGGEEDPETLEALRKEWLQDVSLNKHQFKSLLLQMGVALKDAEMRTLIDAFDSNGDGVITLPEFLDFIGPKRDRKSGSSLVLNQRCCWLTTCRVTGMPNGYSVSNPTKRFLRQEEETKRKESSSNLKLFRPRESEDSKNNDEEMSKTNQANFTGNFVVRKLANGEKRMCVELLDRVRREELLRKLNMLEDKRADEERSKKHDDEGRDEYHDDYEEDDPYAEDEDGHSRHSKDHHKKAATGSRASLEGSQAGVVVTGACDYCTWSAKERREGLKYLMSVTRDAREEELLKTMLTNGTPPSAPKFWIKFEKSLETKSKNRMASLRNGKSRAKSPNEDGDDYDEEQEEFPEEDEEGELGHSPNELTLFWAPSKASDLVSFYSIEFAGAVTLHSKLGDAKYVEVFRDPEDADMGSNFSFAYTVGDLQPGTTYRFRIRAFNGFGPGEYTYKNFTTMTTAPLLPRIIKIAPESVSLRWTFSEGFFKRMEELKKIFTIADKDNSGVVSREELNAALDEQASSMKGLRQFLDKVATSKGLDLSQGYGALFDMIEGDDDNGLSWAEFEVFFLSAGWSSGANNNASGMLASQNVRKSTASFGTMNSATSASNGGKITIKPGDIVYVVERCESEFDDTYKEVLRTNAGQGTLNRLEPGKSYRFRVYSINVDNVRGPCSPVITVHTLLETPTAPTALPKGILARSIAITWKPRNVVTNSRDKAFVDRMLGDWTHSHGENEAGVSIEAAFAKYDKNQSGDIDASELACVLEDLGVEVTDERLSQAFAQLDVNGDGVISFAEFGKWWRADSVTYVVKRSEEIVPSSRHAVALHGTNSENNSVNGDTSKPRAASRGRLGSRPASATMMTPIPEEGSVHGSVVGSTTGRAVSRGRLAPSASAAKNPLGSGLQVAVPVVVYRDTKTRYEVKGLTPNSAYHFKVRYVGSRSNSMLSPPLAIMTAPLAPSTPVLVDVSSNTIRLKWYAPEFGAYKFVVHMRQVLSNTSMRRTAAPIVGVDLKDEGWFNVYNGPETIFTCTTLSTDAAYEIRVFAANYQGNLSEPSPSITFTTMQRNDTSNALTPKNAGNFFTVECTGDICVGDTILITERLFLKPKPGEVMETASRTLAATKAATGKARRSTDTNAGGAAGGGLDNRMNMSVTSITDNDGVSITAANGSFIGERTIAAFVSRDNYRTTRDALTQKNMQPQDREFGAYRKLWLEVVWQRGSTEACKKYEVKPGEVLERIQSHLEQFEVFRIKWRQEGLRRPLSAEWNSLKDCYVDASL